MVRKLFISGILYLILVVGASTCFASNFQKVFEDRNLTTRLGTDKAWVHKFNTPDGEMTFQIRNRANSTEEKRFHLLVKLGKDKVYEWYYPKLYQGGYTFTTIKDTTTSRLFFAIQSPNEAYIYGFDGMAGKFQTYVDSHNYRNNFNGSPKIAVLRDGSLVLAFEPYYGGSNAYNQRYYFSWNEYNRWFAYTDAGAGYSPVSTQEQY